MNFSPKKGGNQGILSFFFGLGTPVVYQTQGKKLGQKIGKKMLSERRIKNKFNNKKMYHRIDNYYINHIL